MEEGKEREKERKREDGRERKRKFLELDFIEKCFFCDHRM